MICVSLGKISFKKCLAILPQVEMAEIRLDLMNISIEKITSLFSSLPHLIATCRQGKFSHQKREWLLFKAIEAGAAYVDLDLEKDLKIMKNILPLLKSKKSRLILSYHNFTETPPTSQLRKLVSLAFKKGADVAKIACYIQTPQDNARLISLLQIKKPVVICGLGALGGITRIAALFCGSPFTYASWKNRPPTAEGQIEYSSLKTLWRLINHD